jgi:multidrug resistance efflux pump
MVIIACLYLVLVWLVFSKLKLLKWGWGAGSVTVLVGAFILAVFLALFNYLTPSGSLTVISRVVEVTPNVSGQVISIPVKANVPVKAGTILLQIDQSPFQAKVRQLDASLAQAQQQANSFRTTNRPPPMSRVWRHSLRTIESECPISRS